MLVRQTYPPERFEIIIVDGKSEDRTCKAVEDFIHAHPGINIRLLENPGLWSSRGRNIGLRVAKGQMIAIIDGHVHIPNGMLFANIEGLREKQQAYCLARPAPLDVPEISTGIAYWIAMARKNWLGHSRNSYIYSDHEGFIDPMSSGFAYDRSVFDKVGYFDESFDAAEDVEFHYRLKVAGISAYTSPDLMIYSYPRSTFYGLFYQQTRYGTGRAKLVIKHPASWTKETSIPSLILVFIALTLSALLLPFTPRVLRLFFVAGTAAYALLLLGAASLQTLKQRRVFMAFPVALAICITHMGLGWGFLQTIFRSKSGVLSAKTKIGGKLLD